MNISHKIHDNFIRCSNLIYIIENRNLITRHFAYKEQVGQKLWNIQNIVNEISLAFSMFHTNVELYFQQIRFPEVIDLDILKSTMEKVSLNYAILTGIKLPTTENTNADHIRSFNREIYSQIIEENKNILNLINRYNIEVQDVRKYHNRPFAFNSLKGLPGLGNFPEVLDLSQYLSTDFNLLKS